MTDETSTPARVRWARLRFAIIGALFSEPPEAGALGPRIEALAARPWKHPTSGDSVRFSAKTIERWYYTARDQQDPIVALERKLPRHAGTHPSVSTAVATEIRRLRAEHPRWTFKLVHDNLVVLAKSNTSLVPVPGYATVCRYMKHHGLGKRRRPRRHELAADFVPRERRSFGGGDPPFSVSVLCEPVRRRSPPRPVERIAAVSALDRVPTNSSIRRQHVARVLVRAAIPDASGTPATRALGHQ